MDHADEPEGGWTQADEAILRDHAAQWEDLLLGVQPDEVDWVYVAELPMPFCGDAGYWRDYWTGQRDEAADNGMPGLWDHLVGQASGDPAVLGIYGPDRYSFWDGNHRAAAAVVSGRGSLPAIVGIARDVGIGELPVALRDVPEILARIRLRDGTAPGMR